MISRPSTAKDMIIFGGIADIPPLSFEEEGVVKGFFNDIFAETAKQAGFDIIIKLYPLKRLFLFSETGEIDGIVSIAYKNEREVFLNYSKNPIFISHLLVFVKKGREFTYNSLKDLFGKKAGVMAGWSLFSNELENAVREGKIFVDEAASYSQNLRKLLADRFDCMVTTELLTWYHINKLGIADDIAVLDNPVSEARTYYAVSRKTKNISNPREFISKMNSALKEVLSDGTYEKYKKKYKLKSLK